MNNSGKNKLLNNFLVSLNKNYFLRKPTSYPININSVGSERGESVLCNEDNFITQGKFVPNSFNSTDHSDILDAKIELREMNIQCLEKIIVGHLNINLTRNKFDALSFVIDTNINILLVSETKLDDSFLSIQFILKGFCTLCELNDLSV